MGQVLQAGAGQIPARQAAVRAGIAMNVPALTINKVCLSGLNAVALADQLIRAGECDVVVAGGMESMTSAPHLLPESRAGFKYGTVSLLDHMADDGLWDVFTDQSMGALTDAGNSGEVQVSRADQDAFAARSHQRAAAATASGVMAEEIVEVKVPQRRGPDLLVGDRRGDPRGRDRRVAGRAAAGVRPGRDDHRRLVQPDLRRGGGAGRGQPGGGGAARGRPRWPRSAPTAWWPVRTPRSSCSRPRRSGSACAKEQIGIADLDLIEINEAFAAVGVASARALGLSDVRDRRRRSTSTVGRSRSGIRSAPRARGWC